MENERKVLELKEGSLDKKDCSMEFYYLSQFKGLIDFNLYRDSTLCENNFYETIAWYIDCLQKENESNWKDKIQDFINSLKDFQGNNIEKLKYIDQFFLEKKIVWLNANGWQTNADFLKLGPRGMKIWEKTYIPNSEGKIMAVFPGIVSPAIPERYYGRFTESGLENKVINENRKNFVDSMKKQREKADNLKKNL